MLPFILFFHTQRDFILAAPVGYFFIKIVILLNRRQGLQPLTGLNR